MLIFLIIVELFAVEYFERKMDRFSKSSWILEHITLHEHTNTFIDISMWLYYV